MKTVIAVTSDPKSGSEEALGRVFNALASAYDFKENGHEVSLIFLGTGTRWVDVMSQSDHPLNGLYQAVSDCIKGASAGCADFFDSKKSLEANNINFLTNNAVPGTSGLPSLAKLAAEGNQILIF